MTIESAKFRRWKKPDRSGGVSKGLAFRIKARAEEFVEGLQPHPGRRMSEKEFLEWVDEETRAEWVDGEVIVMSPVNVEHDDLQGWLNAILRLFVEARDLGRVCGSELAIRLEKPKARRLTDSFFVAKERVGNFEKAAYKGAPDLVVEIVSPDSTTRDYFDKLRTYESIGVKEYWIIDPLSRSVIANEFFKGRFRVIPEKQGEVHSKVLKGFWLRPAWFWQQPLPKVSEVLREIGKA